jgi:hypothetical protein
MAFGQKIIDGVVHVWSIHDNHDPHMAEHLRIVHGIG